MRFKGKIDGLTGSELTTEMLQASGSLIHADPIPEEILKTFDDRLPALLLDFWAVHGVGILEKQGLQLCMPGELAPVISALFAYDPDFGGIMPVSSEGAAMPVSDCHAIAYGPFGKLIVWSERHHLVLVDMRFGLVDAPFLSHPDWKIGTNEALIKFLWGMPAEALDLDDDTGQPMFLRARVRLGALGPGEIYGTHPVISFGDPVDLDHLARVSARDWISERATGMHFTLADIATGRFDIRPIGPRNPGVKP